MTLNEAKDYTLWLAKGVLMGIAFAVVLSWTPLGRDDTDPGKWGARSGVRLITDSRTGCQYLAASDGGITPRLDRDNKQMGCK